MTSVIRLSPWKYHVWFSTSASARRIGWLRTEALVGWFVTGNDESRVLIVNIDRESGELTLDENFKVKGASSWG
ncbi:MAG: hypothetical protein ACR2G5_05655 [Pyrinomonadaceae bacterium]